MAGHDEDPAKVAMGTPLERIVKMGSAMLEAVRTFKPPSGDGKKFEIRLGQLTSIFNQPCWLLQRSDPSIFLHRPHSCSHTQVCMLSYILSQLRMT